MVENVQSWVWSPTLSDAMDGLLYQGHLIDLSIQSRQPWESLGSRLQGTERGSSPDTLRAGQRRGSQ